VPAKVALWFEPAGDRAHLRFAEAGLPAGHLLARAGGATDALPRAS
jgi:hypothetical protein